MDRETKRTLVDRKLRTQLRLFALIFLIVAVVAAERVIQKDVSPLWAVAGFAAGLILGLLLSRTKVLSWNESEGSVIGTSDALGIAILVLYILFIIFRNRILARGIDDADAISVIGLSMTAGAMFGRVFFTVRNVRQIVADAFRMN
jgi:hypothetical protein